MNQKKIIDEIFRTTGVKLEVNDPALLLVAINELATDSIAQKVDTQLTQSTDKFQKVVTTNLDDFIGVANEAISKFTISTRELRAAVEANAIIHKAKTVETHINQNENAKSNTPLLDELHKALKPYLFMAFLSVILLGFVLGFFTAYHFL